MRKSQFACLTLALLFATGCHTTAPTGVPARKATVAAGAVVQLAAPAAYRGTGELALGVGLGAERGYRLQATTAEVEQLVVTLQRDGKTVATTTLARKQLVGSGTGVHFTSLAAGDYVLALDAHDASGSSIGRSTTPVKIASGTVTKLAAALKLDSTPVVTGDLDATITIQDGNPEPSPSPVSSDKLYEANGNVAVRDTNYAIPGGALFVAPGGNDDNAGSEAKPFATLQHAIAAAHDGGTIVLRGGTYRQAAKLAGKRLTLQAYPHEQVWLKGSKVVTGWVKDGNAWRHDNWTVSLMRGRLGKDDVNAEHPLADYADMAFLDGRYLNQVATKGEVKPGTFCVDQKTNQLFVGDNPDGHTLEASVEPTALVVSDADHSVIRGLGFMHYAAHHDQWGAVRLDAAGVTFENNTVAWSASAGLAVFAPNCVVRRNTLVFAGMVGMQANKAANLDVDGNSFAYNNHEHFNSWQAGGAKLCNGVGMLIENNLSEENWANGLWLDVSCQGNTLVHNLCRRNTGHGIFHEISFDGLIAGNVLVDNGHAGIAVSSSGGKMEVYNNTLINNCIDVFNDDRKGKPSNFPGRNFGVTDANVRNNVIVGANDYKLVKAMVGAKDYTAPGNSPSKMGVSFDHDAYVDTTDLPLARWGETTFAGLAAFQGAGQEHHGLTLASTTGLFADNYAPAAASPLRGKGEALPANVAKALGIAADAPTLGAPAL